MCDAFRFTGGPQDRVDYSDNWLTRGWLCYPTIALAALENFDPESSYCPQRPSSQPTWLSSMLRVARGAPVKDSAFSWLSWHCSVSSRRLLAPENPFRLTQ